MSVIEQPARRAARYAKDAIAFAVNPGLSLNDLRAGLIDRGDPEPDEHVLRRVVAAYAAAARDHVHADAPYRLGWKYAEVGDGLLIDAEYVSALQAGDIDRLRDRLHDVMRRIPIGGLLEYATFEELASPRAGTVARAERAIRQRRFATSVMHDVRRWSALVNPGRIHELEPPRVGNPWGYVVGSTLVTGTAPRHHYYANEVAALIHGVDRPRVAEIGGGFGGFAFYLLARCAPSAAYLDFDLPEVVALASYYLLTAFPERSAVLYGEAPLTERTLADAELVLLPNFALASLPAQSVDVFVNSASLSEMHQMTVDRYISDVGRAGRRFFFHDNSDEPVTVGETHEVPAWTFPTPDGFALVRERPSPWFSAGRYVERLLARN